MNGFTALVVNCGSSSLKLAVLDARSGSRHVEMLAERLGMEQAGIHILQADAKYVQPLPNADHRQAFLHFITHLRERTEWWPRIDAVVHRVVHGGERFQAPVLLDEAVIAHIHRCAVLAPLHNQANLQGIAIARQQLPHCPHFAVFDTAFHQSLPATAFLYAIPQELYREHGLRRYGFHGSSHQYLLQEMARRLQRSAQCLNLITLHLGNGCSACAIAQGRSVDTTMGLTPLEGLVMGTRSGDLDPGLLIHLLRYLKLDVDRLDALLNRHSGLLGLSGLSNDMRELEKAAKAGDEAACMAIEIFCYRLAKAVAGLLLACAPVHALVFSGGIGEHSVRVREKTLNWLRPLGFTVDPVRNRRHGTLEDGIITTETSLEARVIPTDEEWLLAQEAWRLFDENGQEEKHAP